MKCSKARKVIPFLVNGELVASQYREVEEHLGRCSACQTIAAEYANLARLTHAMPRPQEPPDFYDEFSRETLNRVSENLRVSPRTDQAPALRYAFRPRYAIVGVGVILAAIVFAVLFGTREDTAQPDRRLTLETYLSQSDFIGLARAMKDGQQRHMLMTDTVSVDLVVSGLERLQRSHWRHGLAGRYLVRYVAMVPHKEIELLLVSTGRLQRPAAMESLHGAIDTRTFDFKKALRALRYMNRPGARVTLNDLIETWALRHKR